MICNYHKDDEVNDLQRACCCSS